ncbi:hypothetical protein BU26DRAFT_520008 [Trematosphaeria pertusa]|uniref:RING-type domain-containing protein n=1 Tax=Trematosphaeria pertusa TaxID=390896 RepID=A0A6A6IFJ6_9PLEO|nr:uncharacterized protein BU26DRAFT_520008 [Trematosphaeria pertusa]KAF2248293.1 hypothetical protein BU26DRAFT_520008 [Trematosphaeria pertusa]
MDDPKVKHIFFFASFNREDYIAGKLTPSAPSAEHVCPICCDEWDPSNNAIVATHCKHIFHRECLLRWFSNDAVGNFNTCPGCRAKCWGTAEDFEECARRVAEEIHRNCEKCAHIWEPVMKPVYLRQVLGVDIEDASNPHRFEQALARILDIPEIRAISEDTDMWNGCLLKAYIVARFAQVYRPQMKPQEWTAILRERGRWFQLAEDDLLASDPSSIIFSGRYQRSLAYDVHLTTGLWREVCWKVWDREGKVLKQGSVTVKGRQNVTLMNESGIEVVLGAGSNSSDQLTVRECLPGRLAKFTVEEETFTVVVRATSGNMLIVAFSSCEYAAPS